MSQVLFMARQPVFDRHGATVAYELLYRCSQDAAKASVDSARAAQSFVSSLLDIGLDQLVRDQTAFINVSEELLLDASLQLLPTDRVVLELLESIPFRPETESAVRRLHELGFQIAVDDFVKRDESEGFLPYAQFAKVDVLVHTAGELARTIPWLRRKGIKVVAEKIESVSQHQICFKLGCEYYQGFLLGRPQTVKGKSPLSTRTTMLKVLGRLQDPYLSFEELDHVLGIDVGFSYRLLKLINCAAFGLQHRVESIRQAAMVLGLEHLTALAALVAMSIMETTSSEIVSTALIRANMAERIALAIGTENPSRCFLAGLLSVADRLMDLPMEDAVTDLPIDTVIVDALTGKCDNSPLAQILRSVLAFERGDFDEALMFVGRHDLLNSTYRSAIMWTREVRSLGEAA